MTFQAKIMDDGRLVFPAELGRALGLQPGDALNVDLRDGEVEVDRVALLEQSLRRVMRDPEVVAEVDDFCDWRGVEAKIEEEKWRRLAS